MSIHKGGRRDGFQLGDLEGLLEKLGFELVPKQVNRGRITKGKKHCGERGSQYKMTGEKQGPFRGREGRIMAAGVFLRWGV